MVVGVTGGLILFQNPDHPPVVPVVPDPDAEESGSFGSFGLELFPNHENEFLNISVKPPPRFVPLPLPLPLPLLLLLRVVIANYIHY